MDSEDTPPQTTTSMHPGVQGAAPDESRLALVRQVLASRTFAKSPRLSRFFEYVCRETLEGRSERINEQQIGVHVFGRSPAYSATDDSIVRTQARLLRQRLEEYFEHECPACPMVVLIPKGGYVPVFEHRSPGGQAPQPSALPLESATNELHAVVHENGVSSLQIQAAKDTAERGETPVQSRRIGDPAGPAADVKAAQPSRSHWPWIGGAVAFIVALMALLLVPSLHLLPGQRHSLWTSIFAAGRPVVIVPSDDGLVLSEELRRAPVTLDEYLSGTYLRGFSAAESASGNTNGDNEGLVTAAWLASHQYTSTADLALAMRLNRLPEAESAQVETRYARALHLEDLKNRNVILIGGIGANPWVGLFSSMLNFDVNYDWKTQQGYVINKSPRPGEQARYNEQKGGAAASSYGVLAYLPGVSGNGSALLFEGSGLAGTEAAADFPFSGDSFTNFLQKISGSSGKAIPYFEVLLETRSVGGDAPGPHVVTWRLIAG